MKRFRLLLGAASLFAAILFLWAVWFEPASLRVESEILTLERLPTTCGELRVALLADLHVGSPRNGLARLSHIVEVTNRAEPDVVLLLGDFVIQGVLGGQFVEPEAIADRLAQLQAPLGVYGVLGNHDWWFDGARVRAALEAENILVLEDSANRLRSASCDVWVVGITDFWEGEHDVTKAIAEVPDGAPMILFTHNPDVFPSVPESVMLTVAGHTHGGQVRLPFVGAPIVPSNYGQRFAAGQVREGGRTLYVSTGVGTSILPVRFRVPPVISLLTLRPDTTR